MSYIVNALLAALNWRLDASPEEGLPNLIPEEAVRSQEGETIRFLDYLGFEIEDGYPLLIVETKRPSERLPEVRRAVSPPFEIPSNEIVSLGLSGEPLKGDWNNWLDSLRDYVRSVHDRTGKAPKRVVITNGDWLVLFLNPSDTFIDGGSRKPTGILVFENRDEIKQRSAELFCNLEYRRVLGEAPPLDPGNLLFHIRPPDITQAMYGLHLKYDENITIHSYKPRIHVAPIVFLSSRHENWFKVEAPLTEYEIPHICEELAEHLEEVRQSAVELFNNIAEILGSPPSVISLSNHYGNDDSFSSLPGVQRCDFDEYYLVTGDRTHYILPETDGGCPYHGWYNCNNEGVAAGRHPIMVRSVSPRSFFVSGESHHCSHRHVASAKESQISAINRALCGQRSGQEGQAFCEIWSFEQFLCCRACVFLSACIQSPIFRLPCIQTPQPETQETAEVE